ncbi:MAG TPA: hypothetical protein VIE70_06805, partial [Dongiaceae bacterium]
MAVSFVGRYFIFKAYRPGRQSGTAIATSAAGLYAAPMATGFDRARLKLPLRFFRYFLSRP